ncbi:zincin-like metallopeptidase domain-containing protein [Paraburkholderia sp. D15]|uniref:ArdC family protein n=1 Tax=Paraburkholderia sp. D15 TaxID=2880218 RepID=UPI002479A1B2|nr:zincin-like metallopeptidase domain-containing protein [Paraburkholderia sp. D15]WGS54485.1 zincin-like metallopeptidase domain-containing protein [Paraburkholderia sp. D15]
MAIEKKGKIDVYEAWTKNMIESLERSHKYETPWFACNELPNNPVTGTRYRGVNFFNLMSAGFQDPRFMTYNNAMELAKERGENIHVRKGETGIPVYKGVQVKLKPREGEDERFVIDENGQKQPAMITVLAYAGTVFNGSQIEGLEPYVVPDREVVRNEDGELIIQVAQEKLGIKIVEHETGGAYYVPSSDTIHVPTAKLFKNDLHRYQTVTHEIAHATGHPTRQNRDMSGKFGSLSYAREELVAEMTSYYLSAYANLSYDERGHENHAAYIQSWLKGAKEEKKYLYTSAVEASKAADLVINAVEGYKLEVAQSKERELSLDQSVSKITVAPEVKIQHRQVAKVRERSQDLQMVQSMSRIAM